MDVIWDSVLTNKDIQHNGQTARVSKTIEMIVIQGDCVKRC